MARNELTSLDVGRPANKCDSKRLDSVREQIRGEQTSKHKEQTERTSPLEMDVKHPGPGAEGFKAAGTSETDMLILSS